MRQCFPLSVALLALAPVVAVAATSGVPQTEVLPRLLASANWKLPGSRLHR
ncbi:hypothetical protein AA0522_1822 [Gluconacetobacter liquefaciens NRIC 0522]|nr:hypothetical protein AA0522_1822 [Gluconacetobacter liquefaciens NRIC 0522]